MFKSKILPSTISSLAVPAAWTPQGSKPSRQRLQRELGKSSVIWPKPCGMDMHDLLVSSAGCSIPFLTDHDASIIPTKTISIRNRSHGSSTKQNRPPNNHSLLPKALLQKRWIPQTRRIQPAIGPPSAPANIYLAIMHAPRTLPPAHLRPTFATPRPSNRNASFIPPHLPRYA